MRDFRDKVAVVTGAGSGIGRALAVALARDGARLALSDVNEAGLAETAALVREARVTTERVDVADRAAVDAHAARVVVEHGRVNLVVNNAGVALSGTIAEVSYDDLAWLFGINFWGVVHGTKAFLPHLERSGDGHVVNLSSVFGLIGVPGQGAYNAAKFAVRGFTECLREELDLAGSCVSATCVHPGGIRTNIARNARVTARPGGPDGDAMSAAFDQVARTTADAAAARILAGVRRNARRVLVGADAYAIDVLQRLLPTAYQRIVVAAARRSPIPP